MIVTAKVPLDGISGPTEPHEVRDTIVMTLHRLLTTADPATVREVSYPVDDFGDIRTATVTDPYRWDLSTLALDVRADGGQILITAECEPRP